MLIFCNKIKELVQNFEESDKNKCIKKVLKIDNSKFISQNKIDIKEKIKLKKWNIGQKIVKLILKKRKILSYFSNNNLKIYKKNKIENINRRH